MEVEHLGEKLEHIGDVLWMNVSKSKVKMICRRVRSISVCRMKVKGPNKACSKVGNVSARADTMNLLSIFI